MKYLFIFRRYGLRFNFLGISNTIRWRWTGLTLVTSHWIIRYKWHVTKSTHTNVNVHGSAKGFFKSMKNSAYFEIFLNGRMSQQSKNTWSGFRIGGEHSEMDRGRFWVLFVGTYQIHLLPRKFSKQVLSENLKVLNCGGFWDGQHHPYVVKYDRWCRIFLSRSETPLILYNWETCAE